MAKTAFKYKVPKLLLYCRLVFVFIILLMTFFPVKYGHSMVLGLIYVGVLSDIFDGIIARKLNVSNETLRVLDTLFDLLFYASIVLYIFKNNPKIFSENLFLIFIIIGLESMMYAVSLFRFKKFPSPHALLSKFWGLYLICEFTLILLGIQGIHFTIALFAGILVHTDRLLIYLIVKSWHHDVPSCFHALKLRQGKSIRRIKLFNG
jgi:phosphatidylglycerophosphate synthase